MEDSKLAVATAINMYFDGVFSDEHNLTVMGSTHCPEVRFSLTIGGVAYAFLIDSFGNMQVIAGSTMHEWISLFPVVTGPDGKQLHKDFFQNLNKDYRVAYGQEA